MYPPSSDSINVQGLQKNYIHIKLKMSAHHHPTPTPTPTRFESWKTRAMTRHWNYEIKKRDSIEQDIEIQCDERKTKTYSNNSSSRSSRKSKCSAPCEWKCLHGKIEKETKKNENKFRTPTSIHTYTAQTHIFLNNSNTESLCVLSPSPFLFPLSLSSRSQCSVFCSFPFIHFLFYVSTHLI